jgi:hypothetical protein
MMGLRFFWPAILFCGLSLAVRAADFDAGVAAYERGDYAAAYQVWRPLAEGGDRLAQYNLGLLYDFGMGVARDGVEAARWYGRSAEQGYAAAQLAVGDLYMDGFWGAPDPTKAAVWYRYAADQGLAEAARKLAALPGARVGTQVERPVQDTGRGARRSSSPSHCPEHRDREFVVAVDIEVPPAPINHELSSAELTEGSFHGRRGRVLGLMVPDLDISTQGHYSAVRHGGAYCFWANRIDVTLQYHSIEVFIAAEYDERSCAYREILKHEKAHVRVARENLERYAPRVRYALTSLLIPKPTAPKQVASPEAAKTEMNKLFAKLLKPVYEEMLDALVKAQRALDTPASYRRVKQRCRNW